jgi:hypothetical protein
MERSAVLLRIKKLIIIQRHHYLQSLGVLCSLIISLFNKIINNTARPASRYLRSALKYRQANQMQATHPVNLFSCCLAFLPRSTHSIFNSSSISLNFSIASLMVHLFFVKLTCSSRSYSNGVSFSAPILADSMSYESLKVLIFSRTAVRMVCRCLFSS